MHARTLSAVTAAAIVLILSSGTIAARQDVRAAIDAANKQFAAAFAKGDAAALAAMYSATGQAFPPNGDVVRGAAALQKLWQDAMASGVKELVLTTTETEGHGDTAIEVGSYRMDAAAGKTVDRGKYVVIWKRENGQWKVHRDIWNTSMPAPPAR